MDIAVDLFLHVLFYLVCGACIGAALSWSLTYLWCHPELEHKEPPPIMESGPRTWDELQVSMQEAQRESAP